jgi:hypothetical protein
MLFWLLRLSVFSGSKNLSWISSHESQPCCKCPSSSQSLAPCTWSLSCNYALFFSLWLWDSEVLSLLHNPSQKWILNLLLSGSVIQLQATKMLVPLYLTYRCLLLPASPSSFLVELLRNGRRKGNNQFLFFNAPSFALWRFCSRFCFVAFVTGSHCVLQVGLELGILLLQHSECWDYRYDPPSLAKIDISY